MQVLGKQLVSHIIYYFIHAVIRQNNKGQTETVGNRNRNRDIETEGHKYGKTEKQVSLGLVDRKTERQRDRQTERQKDRKTERQKDRKTERQNDRMTERQRDRETERQRDRKTERQKDRTTE